MENKDGTKEVLTDYQSFAAGYRQAVMDLSTEESPSIFPLVVGLLIFMVILKLSRMP